MSKSARLQLNDLRALHTLVNECRDLGADPVTWRTHLFRGLARLVGAGIVYGGELAGLRVGPPLGLGVVDLGWENGFNRDGWLNSLKLMEQQDSSAHIHVESYLKRATTDGECYPRTQILTDREWYNSAYYSATFDVMGLDHTLACVRQVPSLPGVHTAVTLARRAGAPDFTGRQAAVVRESQLLIAPLVGGPLAQFREPSPLGLAPRVREVLRCLLEGDSDKQIAARLQISKFTVNQYVKVIFAHFTVTTRTELLARWIRRGWRIGNWGTDRT